MQRNICCCSSENLELKKKLYDRVVMPRVIGIAETCAMRIKDTRKVDVIKLSHAFEHNMLMQCLPVCDIYKFQFV